MRLAWSSGVAVAVVFSLASRVSAQDHAWSGPVTLSGPAVATVGRAAYYRSYGAKCNKNHRVVYRFSWGDKTPSTKRGGMPWGAIGWKAWLAPGRYSVQVDAACVGGLFASSPVLWVDVLVPHAVSAPFVLYYSNSPYPGYLWFFSPATGSCSRGHPVTLYQFYWGDGTSSPWFSTALCLGVAHRWSTGGTYGVRARVKCREGAVSGWSGGLTVDIHPIPRGWSPY